MKTRHGCCAFFLLLFCVIPSLDAGAQEAASEVMAAKTVFAHPNGILFFADGNVFGSALLGEDGIPYEMTKEGGNPYEITHVAVEGDSLYMNTSGGICRMNLAEYGQEGAQVQNICGQSPSDGFFLCGDSVYFCADASLYRANAEGGVSEELAAGVEDYELTDGGIYYTQEDGGLYFVSLDGTGGEKLCDTFAESHVALGGNYLYFWAAGDPTLGFYSLSEQAAGQLTLPRNLSNEYFFATPEYFLYMGDDYDGVWRYDLASAEETRLARMSSVPFQDNAAYAGGLLYAFDRAREVLLCMNAQSDWVYPLAMSPETETETEDAGDSYDTYDLYEAEEEYVMGDPGPAADAPESLPMIGYDIVQDIIVGADGVLTTSHFQLTLPADGNWVWETVGDDVLRILHQPSQQAGCGGSLVSIRAFDEGDDSYVELPDFQIAGTGGGKTYVAIFPTDVQADVQNERNTEEYNRLLHYMRRIDADNADNPFVVLGD